MITKNAQKKSENRFNGISEYILTIWQLGERCISHCTESEHFDGNLSLTGTQLLGDLNYCSFALLGIHLSGFRYGMSPL